MVRTIIILLVAFAALQEGYGFPRIQRQEALEEQEEVFREYDSGENVPKAEIALTTEAPEPEEKVEEKYQQVILVPQGSNNEGQESQENEIEENSIPKGVKYYTANQYLQTVELSQEEIRKDIARVEQAIVEEEQKVGHPLNTADLKNVEENLEKKPWYRRFAKWASNAFDSTRNALSNVFGKREVPERDARYSSMPMMF